MTVVIEFFAEDIDYTPPTPANLKSWIEIVIQKESRITGDINFIFCSDQYLLDINIQYLDHHYKTDVITFDLSEAAHEIAGDVFISIDRVKANALEYQADLLQELKRVMVHGVLHLIGYDDKSAEQKLEMRKKEEAYLSL